MAGSRARRRGGFALAAATVGLVAFAGLRARSSGATAQLATILGSEGALFVPSAFSPSSNASVNGIPLYDDEAPLGAYRPNLYKKTHSSLDPINERIWLVSNFGFPWSGADEYWYDGAMASSTREVHMAELSDQVDLCAYRATFTFLGNYLWHELGSTTAYEWDAYVYLSSAFYVPSIDAHALTLSKNGVPHLKRSYAGAAGETWYVVFAFNPYNGETIALHSGTTAYRGEYPAFEASMCVDAIALPFTVARYQAWWASFNATFDEASGLPDVLPALVSQPTHNATGVADFLRSAPAALYDWNVNERVGDAREGQATGASGGACRITEIMAYTSIMEGDDDALDAAILAPVRFVESSARTGDLSVADYVDLVDKSVRAFTGQDAGYSRWLDNHVGLGNTLYKRPVDELAAWLERVDVPWHAHYTEMASDDDAAETLGPLDRGRRGPRLRAPRRLQLHRVHPVGELDYCTRTSVCRAEDYAQCGLADDLVSSLESPKKER
ncbi:hypothetical protein JL721_11440 [Aureococcus anophagefferens]|nr:hypothetical protein JL721_11440 [Aureococcus anophagefferens]